MNDLKKCSSLAFIDLLFAERVLNKLGSCKEEHAALLAVLFAVSRQGHLVLDVSQEKLTESLKLLGIEDPSLAALVQKGAETFPEQSAWVRRLDTSFYLQKNWVYESEIHRHLGRLTTSVPTIAFSEWVPSAALNALQKEAVENGMSHTLSLLTGGPGTGKTFTAVELVKACLAENKHFRIIVTAPTGKAVAQLEGNLRKAVGEDARIVSGTLHAILGLKAHGQHEEAQPLFADLVIVDECSMIDAKIFARLLGAVSNGTRLVLIGDKDQLPPVESGSVFADLIESRMFPSTCLTECLRSDRMEILGLAKVIREGNVDAALSLLSEIEWIDLEEEHHFVPKLWERCQQHFVCFFEEKPSPETILGRLGAFSILSCMRQGPLGVDAVNNYFLHQSFKRVPVGSWWVAPVMVTRNDYELELFNGDLGFVVRKVGPDFSLRQFDREDYALFPDRKGGLIPRPVKMCEFGQRESSRGFGAVEIHTFDRAGYRQLSALALNAFEYSYALSVHKSQGSEYDEVLILIPEGSEAFGREVLYTALTRARRKVALAGSKAVLREAIGCSSRKNSNIVKGPRRMSSGP